jgi:hypothetical protein
MSHFHNPKGAVKVLQFVAPASAAAGTVNGNAVDVGGGYDAVLAIILAGTVPASHTVNVKLQDGDNVGILAADKDVLPAALVAADSNTQKKLGYARQAAGKQVRVQVIRAGTGSSDIGWMILGLNPASAPQN